MPVQHTSEDLAYLRLVARCLWRPGLQRRLDLSDVVQNTIKTAHVKQEQFRGTTAQEWRGWLRAILLTELARAARDNQPGELSLNESSQRLEDALAEGQTSPSEAAVKHEDLARLALALDQLSDDERTAIELKYIHDCSVAFISEAIGRTTDAVAGLLKRGKDRLRAMLEEQP